MREQDVSPSRRRRKNQAKEKVKERRFRINIKSLLPDLRSAFKIFNIVAALITLYITASLYTPWTGDAGAATAGWLLANVGGAVIVPLIFLLYTEIKLITSSPMEGWTRRFCGMLCIFIFLSMTLGLNKLTGGERQLAFPFLAAGRFGYGMSAAIYKSTGILGTVFAGLLTIYLTLMAFEIRLFSNVKLPAISLPGLFRRKKRPAQDGEDEDEEEYEYEDNLDETDDDDERDAPNISEFDGDKDYFDYDEEDPEGEAAYDRPPAAKPGRAPARESAGGAGDEEDVDYNDPESLKKICGTETRPAIQDPNFSFEDDGTRRVKQGIFPPPIEIFGPSESRDGEMDEEKAAPLGEKIVRALEQFGIESHLAEILVGPTVIQFSIQLAPGIKVN